MTFVFCSLLELAWVGYLSRAENKPPPMEQFEQLNTIQSDRATNIVAPVRNIATEPQKMDRSTTQYNDNSGGFTNLLQR